MTTTRAIPSTPTAGLARGLWFVFRHADHQFALWISSFSGKEEFYLDGSLVAETRKIGLSSDHVVATKDATFRLELRTLDLRRGIFTCRLLENEVEVAALETEYVVKRRMQQGVALLAGTAIVLYGVLSLDASPGVACAAVAATCALVYACLGRGSGYVMRAVRPADEPEPPTSKP